MPEFSFPSDDPRVGLRDDEGAITRVPEQDLFGVVLYNTANLTMVRLDHHHFVFAPPGSLKEGMTFRLEEPSPAEPPSDEEETSEDEQ